MMLCGVVVEDKETDVKETSFYDTTARSPHPSSLISDLSRKQVRKSSPLLL